MAPGTEVKPPRISTGRALSAISERRELHAALAAPDDAGRERDHARHRPDDRPRCPAARCRPTAPRRGRRQPPCSARPTRVFWKKSASTMTRIAAITAAEQLEGVYQDARPDRPDDACGRRDHADDAQQDEPGVVQRRRLDAPVARCLAQPPATRRASSRPRSAPCARPVHDSVARNVAVLLALPWMKAASGPKKKRVTKKASPSGRKDQRRRAWHHRQAGGRLIGIDGAAHGTHAPHEQNRQRWRPARRRRSPTRTGVPMRHAPRHRSGPSGRPTSSLRTSEPQRVSPKPSRK